MKLQNKKQILRGLLLCVGVIIIALSLFYLYNYLNNNHNTYKEGFTDYNKDVINYQHINTGDPLGKPTTIVTKFTFPVFPSPQSPNKYYLDGLQNITNNSKFIYALDASANISYFDNSTNTWKSSYVVANLQSPRANFINKIKPSVTNPNYDTSTIISCNNTTGLLLTANQKTLFYYNEGTNDSEHVDCLYYMNLNSDGKIPSTGASFKCLELPTLDTNNIKPTSAGSTSPSMNFDKINFIAANNNILFALGCNINKSTNSTNLYYCILNSSGSPTSNDPSNWKTISVSLPNYTIKKIYVNDNCLFIYYIYTNSTTTPKSNTFLIKYSPIKIEDDILTTLNLQTFCDTSINDGTSLFQITSFDNISVNNDVMWTYNSYARKLWWCALKDGIPDSSIKWNSYSCTDSNGNRSITGISYMILYNNMLVIFTNPNTTYIIPLYNSSSSGTGSSGTASTSSNPTGTATPTGTGTATPTGTGTVTPTGTGTATPTGTVTPTGTGTATPTGTGPTSTLATPTGTDPTNTSTNNTNPNTTKSNNHHHRHKHHDSINSLLGDFDLNKFFGNNDDNRNLYISPMNNSSLYDPSNANRVSKIDSAFFPMVRLN